MSNLLWNLLCFSSISNCLHPTQGLPHAASHCYLVVDNSHHYIVALNNKIQAKLCLLLRFMRFWPRFEETNHVDKFNGLSRAKRKNPTSIHYHTHHHKWFRVFDIRIMCLNLSSMSFMRQFGHLNAITP